MVWALRGLRTLLSNEWDLVEPKAVVEATAQYRNSENRLGDFIAECCEIGGEYAVTGADLRGAYYQWCEEQHIRNAYGERTFGKKLEALQYTNKQSHGVRKFHGLKLNRDWASKVSLRSHTDPNKHAERIDRDLGDM